MGAKGTADTLHQQTMVSKLKPLLMTLGVVFLGIAIATRVSFIRDLVYGTTPSSSAN